MPCGERVSRKPELVFVAVWRVLQLISLIFALVVAVFARFGAVSTRSVAKIDLGDRFSLVVTSSLVSELHRLELWSWVDLFFFPFFFSGSGQAVARVGADRVFRAGEVG
eukprot:2540299-Rhodomonas_salina.2